LTAAMFMSLFVIYGFDTASTLAEETRDPRREAPKAVLASIIGGLESDTLSTLQTMRQFAAASGFRDRPSASGCVDTSRRRSRSVRSRTAARGKAATERAPAFARSEAFRCDDP